MNMSSVIDARLAVQDRYGPLLKPEQSYLVLMSPRSGSTLLCVHLEKIGYGRPTEGFHFSQRALRQRYGNDVDFSNPYEHIRTVLEFGTQNGCFGLKFNWLEFEIFLEKARKLTEPSGIVLNDAELVQVFFPNPLYIHLKRRNKVKQAVSYARAMQTGIWNVGVEQNEDYKDYILPAIYDRQHIECLLDNLMAFDLSWEHYLARYEIPFLELWYEDFAQDYSGKMREVYDFLGITQEQVINPPLKKLADEKSKNWVERFRAETAWLHDQDLAAALESGDVATAYLLRTRMLMRAKERARWNAMLGSRFRGIRKLLLRIKNKLSL